MKEVFEKIIEQLKEWTFNADINVGDGTIMNHDLIESKNAIEIVKQAVAEYNNDWIPCSERFPKVEDLHEKSVDDCTCYLIQRRCGIMDVAHYIKVYGEPYFESNSIKMKDVVAWMPLPQPYQPKGEQ